MITVTCKKRAKLLICIFIRLPKRRRERDSLRHDTTTCTYTASARKDYVPEITMRRRFFVIGILKEQSNI